MSETNDKSVTRVWLTTGMVVRNYVIESRIAASGMGEVYLAKERGTKRVVALKILPAPPNCNAEQLEALAQQMNSQPRPHHRAICETYEVGVTEKGKLFVASEYVSGHSLDELLMAKFDLNVEKIAEQLAVVLQAAHQSGFLHADLKMSDIMLTAEGKVKVLDFGLTKYKQLWERSAQEALVPRDKRPSRVRHLAPEQVNGLSHTPQSDLFSLGTILYELVTGFAPFTGETPLKVCAAIVWQKPEPLTELAPDAPAGLCASISQLIEKDPSQRTASAQALLTALKAQLVADTPHAKHFGAAAFQAGQRFMVTDDGRMVAGFGKGVCQLFFSEGANWAVLGLAAVVACYALVSFLNIIGVKH